MTAIFLEGNSRDVLRNLPPDFVHCVVTSPPYFGLRKYDGGEEVWDGDDGCRHKWGEELPGRRRRSESDIKDPLSKQATNSANAFDDAGGQFCSLCGAWRGQLGAEPTPDLYIQHLIQIMREVRRVLRPDGVFWLNIGDSYWGSGGSAGHTPETKNLGRKTSGYGAVSMVSLTQRSHPVIKPLDMILIPEQLAITARADGWYVRSILIWAKGVSLSNEFNGNPMPASLNGWRFDKHRIKVGDRGRGREAWRKGANETPQQDHDKEGNFLNSAVWEDCPGCPKCEKSGGYILRKGSWRPTNSYEHILMLTKTNSYFCDREAVLEQGVYPAGEHRAGGEGHKHFSAGSRTTEGLHNKDWNGSGGRNLRSVLAVPTAGFPGSHFAVYPPKLIEPLVKAATSEKGCCPKCGSPWARVVDRRRLTMPELAKDDPRYRPKVYEGAYGDINGHGNAGYTVTQTLGWLPTCSCGADLAPDPCCVLDPFSGAGTTALVCERLGLTSINVDTSPEYIKIAETRLVEDEQKRVDEQIKQLRREAKRDARSIAKDR